MFTPTLNPIAQDRAQQLRDEARRDGAARLARAARRRERHPNR